MALVALSDIKSYLGISITDTTDDSFLNLLISGVQETVENYCERHFEVDTYTEQHIITHKIFPRQYPIKSVDKISRIGTGMTNLDTNEVTNYKIVNSYIDLLDYQYLTMSNRLKYSNSEESYVEITYTAGYDTIPFDLQLAVIKLVVLEYKKSREDRLGVESEREGAVQRVYEKKDSEMPMEIEKVLIRYKKVSL